MRQVLAALAGVMLLAAARPAPQEVRFTHVDLYLDPGAEVLSAWQVELLDPSGRARVVGVEGGDDAAWRSAPYYDPAALQGGRIVLAAFTLDGGPRGRQRVARVHLAVEGAAAVRLEAEVQAAANAEMALDDVRVEVAR